MRQPIYVFFVLFVCLALGFSAFCSSEEECAICQGTGKIIHKIRPFQPFLYFGKEYSRDKIPNGGWEPCFACEAGKKPEVQVEHKALLAKVAEVGIGVSSLLEKIGYTDFGSFRVIGASGIFHLGHNRIPYGADYFEERLSFLASHLKAVATLAKNKFSAPSILTLALREQELKVLKVFLENKKIPIIPMNNLGSLVSNKMYEFHVAGVNCLLLPNLSSFGNNGDAGLAAKNVLANWLLFQKKQLGLPSLSPSFAFAVTRNTPRVIRFNGAITSSRLNWDDGYLGVLGLDEIPKVEENTLDAFFSKDQSPELLYLAYRFFYFVSKDCPNKRLASFEKVLLSKPNPSDLSKVLGYKNYKDLTAAFRKWNNDTPRH